MTNTTSIKCYHKNLPLGYGEKPANILFIGNQPSLSEMSILSIFPERLRKFLDKMLYSTGHNNISYFVTNMVFCPCGERTDEKVLFYKKQLFSIVDDCRPKVYIFMSKEVESYYKKELKPFITIPHPEYLMRTGGTHAPFYLPTISKMKGFINENFN
jgi:uracil-DNA glycosylase family 4